MVDLASLDAATLGTVTRFHNFAKNIETAQLGAYYTTCIDNIDYFVVECVAKPVLAKTPEWVYENRIVTTLLDNKGLVILAGSIITFIFIVIMLHPQDQAPYSTGPDLTKKTPLPSDKKEGSATEDTDSTLENKDSDDSILLDVYNINTGAKKTDDGIGVFSTSEKEDAESEVKDLATDGTPTSPADPDNGVENKILNNPNNHFPLDHTAGESERQKRLKNKLSSFLFPTTTSLTPGDTTSESEVKDLAPDGTPTSPADPDDGVENNLNNNSNNLTSLNLLPTPEQHSRKERLIRILSPVTDAANNATGEIETT
jgi:hypothetical protein